MKKVLLLSALVAFGCGEKKSDTASAKKESKAKTEVKERAAGTLKLAFYYQDSVATQFDYYRKQESIITAKQKEFQAEVDRMTRNYQEFLQRNDQKAQQGLLSQVQIQKIQEEAAKRQQQIMEFQQSRGGQLENEALQKSDEIGRKIDNYARMFCEENGLDIMLVHGRGGQVAYAHPSMDMTADFVAFLNEHEDEIQKDMAE